MLSVIRSALTSPEFLAGLVPGLIGAVAASGAGLWWKQKTGEPMGAVGVLFAVGAVFAMPEVRSVPMEVLLGLVLLALAGMAGAVVKSSPFQVLAALPGAWLLTSDLGYESAWVTWAVIAAIAIGGPLVGASDRVLIRPILGPAFFAIAVGGVYVNVPDTEEMLVLLGVMAPLAVLGWPLSVARLGGVGSQLAVGVLMWAAAWGGIGRPASLLGAAACLGLLLVVPFVRRIATIEKWPLLTALHLVVVLVAARVAGFRNEPIESGLIAGAVLVVGFLAARAILVGEEEGLEQEPLDPTPAPSARNDRQ